MDSERGIAQFVVLTVFGAFATFLVILRLLCRPLSKPSLGLADNMIVVVLVFRSDITPQTAKN